VSPTARRIVVWVSVGLALLLLLAGSLAIWAKRQALSTDNWTTTSGRLLEDPAVRDLTAAEMVDALFSNTDIQQRIAEVLPPRAEGLAAPATGLLRQAAVTGAEDLLQRPAVLQLWEAANRLAHEKFIALVEGKDQGIVQSSGEDVVLDLSPLVERLSARLGIQAKLKPDAGRIVIMKSDELGAAQDAVKVIRALSILLLIGAAALVSLAVWLAAGYRRTVLLVVGAGLVGVGAVLLVVRRVVGSAVIGALTDPTTKDAGQAVWTIGTDLLRDVAIGLVVYGGLLLLGAWLAGPSRWAVEARRRLAPAMRAPVAWIYSVVAVVVLALLAWGPGSSDRRLLGSLILAALAVTGVELLRRQIVREYPRDGALAP
jgi:hypothetical protein